MGRVSRRQILAAGSALLVLAAAGLFVVLSRGEDASRLCTLIGSANGVGVRVRATEPEIRRATACVNSSCRRLYPPRNRPHASRDAFVEIPERQAGPHRFDVVLVLERAGRQAEVTTGRVRLERYEPNGPGCGTPYWNASVLYDNGALRQLKRRAD